MGKNEYESLRMEIITFGEDDVIRTSPTDVGVDGSQQEGWWGTN